MLRLERINLLRMFVAQLRDLSRKLLLLLKRARKALLQPFHLLLVIVQLSPWHPCRHRSRQLRRRVLPLLEKTEQLFAQGLNLLLQILSYLRHARLRFVALLERLIAPGLELLDLLPGFVPNLRDLRDQFFPL